MKIDRIATLSASGLTPAAISTIVGVSPARISQIQATDEYKETLQAKTVELAEKDQEELSLSAKYLEAEHLLVKQVIEMAPISELRDVVGALRVVAERQEKAKARMNSVFHAQPVFNNIVQLQLPQHATPELAYGQNREVLAIENRALTPLSSSGVLGLFKSMASEATSRVSARRELAAIEGEQHESRTDLGFAEGSTAETLSTDSNPGLPASPLKETRMSAATLHAPGALSVPPAPNEDNSFLSRFLPKQRMTPVQASLAI